MSVRMRVYGLDPYTLFVILTADFIGCEYIWRSVYLSMGEKLQIGIK